MTHNRTLTNKAFLKCFIWVSFKGNLHISWSENSSCCCSLWARTTLLFQTEWGNSSETWLFNFHTACSHNMDLILVSLYFFIDYLFIDFIDLCCLKNVLDQLSWKQICQNCKSSSAVINCPLFCGAWLGFISLVYNTFLCLLYYDLIFLSNLWARKKCVKELCKESSFRKRFLKYFPECGRVYAPNPLMVIFRKVWGGKQTKFILCVLSGWRLKWLILLASLQFFSALICVVFRCIFIYFYDTLAVSLWLF